MATYNVTIHRHNGSGWDDLFPETIIAQINGIDTVGENLLGIADQTVVKFIKINADNSLTLLDAGSGAGTLANEISAAAQQHTHTADEISHNATGLDVIIANKADLINGEIDPNQIPDFIYGGLRFEGAFDEQDNTNNPTLEWLLTQITGSTDNERVGAYFICTEVGSTGTVTVGTGTGHTWQAPGDEGDSTGDVDIEPGDWIVYLGSNNWAVVNNTTQVATQAAKGVVALADGLALSRADLDTDENDGLNVLNEASARKVIRDVFYQSGTPTGLEGDLWFEGSFA